MDNDCKDLAGPSDSAATSWSKLMGMPGKNGQHKGKHKYVTSIFYPFCATNAHLPGTNRKRDSDSDDEYPLPLANYTTLKDKQLKDMLVEQGLPMSGDRPLWEQRHQRCVFSGAPNVLCFPHYNLSIFRWVMIFNANLDKSIPNRRTRADLKKDLKKWEEERGKKKKFAVKDSVNYQVCQNLALSCMKNNLTYSCVVRRSNTRTSSLD
jgi:E3 ubiquitin-protein ligase RAD18